MITEMGRYTIEKVTKGNLCTSCGICAGSCPKNCISIHKGEEINIPVINKERCVDCGICYNVCPGKGINLNKESERLFSSIPSIQRNNYAGYYLHTYVGHSNDNKVRMHCATGGMVTQFLSWLLEKKVIKGAVVIRFNKDNPLEPESFIATTKEELWESRSSKYVILSQDRVAKEIAKGKYRDLVVVGLPCQIQGWRKLAEKNKLVNQTIKGYFAIYCSINKTKLSMAYYPRHYKIDMTQIGRFAFRDDGCMGYMKFEDKYGELIKRIPYSEYWFGTHSFFTNPRCLMCIDQLGELADISFGDIHIKPYSDDTIGTNSIIARTSYWDGLLKACKSECIISLDEISIDTLLLSQVYVKTYKKGAGGKAYLNIKKFFGRNTPIYDCEYKGTVSIKHYCFAFCQMLMHEIGKRRSLWRIVEFLDKSK